MRAQLNAKLARTPRNKTVKRKGPSSIEAELARQFKAADLGGFFVPEFRFCPGRKWRIDYACIDKRIAIELEGVTGGAGGRHQRKAGFEKDCEKYNTLALEGWLLLRFTGAMVRNGSALQVIERALDLR